MNIQELEDKHRDVYWNMDGDVYAEESTKLSVEFAIEILKSLPIGKCWECIADIEILNKIQELKQYLDE